MNDLDARIKKLERSRGWHRWSIILISLMLLLTAVFGVGLSIALTGGLAFIGHKMLVTRHLMIVDENNLPVVHIGSVTEGGFFTTLNSSGEHIVFIGHATTEDSVVGLIATTNGKGQNLVRIGATVDGEGGTVTTFNGKGQNLVRIGVDVKGRGVFSVENGEGEHLVQLGATKDGRGIVEVLDPTDSEKRRILTP